MFCIIVQIVVGWFVIDLLTGLYHWFVDTRRDGGPFLRGQVQDFQIHHQKPTLILTHNIFARCGLATIGSTPALLFACYGLPWFWLTVFFGGALSQQAHYWTHHPKPSRLVVILQDCGLLLSRDGHARHHKDFLGSYCILNGWANPLLDRFIALVR